MTVDKSGISFAKSKHHLRLNKSTFDIPELVVATQLITATFGRKEFLNTLSQRFLNTQSFI